MAHAPSPRRRLVLTLSLLLSSVAVVLAAPATPVEASSGNSLTVAAPSGLNGVYGCTVRTDRTLECWGSNTYGQLGTGSLAYAQTPVQTVGISNVDSVSSSGAATCAVTLAEKLWCWGYGPYVPDGSGTPTRVTTPVEITTLTGVKGVALADHGCAVLHNGEVWCWGDSDNGKLGLGAVAGVVHTPTQVPGITDAVEVGVDDFKTCVLHATGSISCFGRLGEWFGAGYMNQDYPTPQAGSFAPGSDLAMGSGAVCLLDAGQVYCYAGLDGNGGTPGQPATNLTDAVHVATGGSGACAVRANGELACWGAGSAVGETSGVIATPTAIAGEPDVTGVAMAVGGNHMCFSRGDGTIACQGQDPVGAQLDNILSPTIVSGVAASDVSVGGGHSCALTTVGSKAMCWGDAKYINGVLGIPVGATEIATLGSPLDVVAAGSVEICGSSTSGTLQCAEENNASQIVVTDATGFPADLEALDVSPTNGPLNEPPSHRCAISNGEVWCVGQNNDGQLGTNSTIDTTSAVKAQFPALTATAVDIATGGRHTCSRHSDGTAWCWGRNFSGQLGDSTNTDRLVPVQVTGFPALTQVVSIAAGSDTTCAALSNGEAWCWGSNTSDVLGLGPSPSIPVTGSTNVPLKVDSSADVAQVAIGNKNACYRKTTGVVWCWGDLTTGARGDGKIFFSGGPSTGTLPSVAAEIPSFTATDIDGFYSLQGSTFSAISTSDTVWCWGVNRAGVTGVQPESAVPVEVNITGTAISTTTTTTTTSTTTTTTTTPTTTPTTSTPTTTTTTTPTTTLPGGSTTTSTVPTTSPPLPAVDPFTAIAPARLLETRTAPGLTTIDDLEEGAGRRLAGSETTVRLAGRAGIAADARAVVINVTAVNPAGPGFLTIHPCLADLPTAASLNYLPGSALGNEVVAALDANGDLCIFTSAEAHVTIDAVAYVAADSPYAPTSPTRLADTRPTGDTADGTGPPDGRVQADTEIIVQVAGRAGVPTGTPAAVLNIAAVGPGGGGFITAHPCIEPRPLSASLNYRAGVNRSNEIIAPLDVDGRVCVYTSADTHLVVDVVGSLPAGSAYTPIEPGRFLDTRPTGETIDSLFFGPDVNPAGSEIRLDLAARGAIPADAEQVSIYLSAIRPSANGFATVHPCLASRPNSSSLNYATGVNGGNDLIVELDGDGDICIYTNRSTHLSVDVAGYTT